MQLAGIPVPLGRYIQHRLQLHESTLQPTADELGALRAMEARLPHGATVLVTSASAYLLSFRDRTYWFNDQPGLAGPLATWYRQPSPDHLITDLQHAGVQYAVISSDDYTFFTNRCLDPHQARTWIDLRNFAASQFWCGLRESGIAHTQVTEGQAGYEIFILSAHPPSS